MEGRRRHADNHQLEDEHLDPRPDDRREENDRDRQHGNDRRVRTRPWTPWLLVRYHALDNGVGRPVPNGTVFWASPDIWVDSSNPAGNPVAGEANFVHARVFNLGSAQSRPTRFDFYWMAPSPAPGPWLMGLIGTETREVPYHRSLDVKCSTPWIPQFGGHECLIVNCTNDIADPISLPFLAQFDRHVGQKNVTVVAASPGQTTHFKVFINNIAPMAMEVVVTARLEHVAVARTALASMTRRDIINHVASFDRTMNGPGERQPRGGEVIRDLTREATAARSGVPIESKLSEPVATVAASNAKSYFGALLLADDGRRQSLGDANTSRDIALHDVRMAGLEQRRLDLTVGMPYDAQPGKFVVAHILQHIAGMHVGGYTIVMEVPAGR
jgi:hypothetical protein